jgi:AraC-like DNA-binding protein
VTWNLRTVLLLIAAVQGMVAAMLLLRRGVGRRRWSDIFLGLLLLVLCGNLTPHLIGWAGAYDRWQGLSFFPFASSFATGPLIWFAVRALTTADFQPRWRDAVHALPFVIEKAFYLWAWSHDLAWKDTFDATVQRPLIVPAEDLLQAFSVAAYLVAAWRTYRAYRHQVDASESDAGYQLEWLRRFLLVAGTAAVIAFVMDVAHFIHPFGYDVAFFRVLLFALFTYWLALTALVLDPRPAPVQASAPTAPGPAPEAPTGSDLSQWKARVEQCMAVDRPWLTSTLTLADLARRLGCSPATLSGIINSGFDRNFNDFINGYRVRAVQEALATSHGDQTVLALALDHGFNAKSTFNRAFRKETGRTPTEYLASTRHVPTQA